jgi:hypothetical protein
LRTMASPSNAVLDPCGRDKYAGGILLAMASRFQKNETKEGLCGAFILGGLLETQTFMASAKRDFSADVAWFKTSNRQKMSGWRKRKSPTSRNPMRH